MTALDTPVVLLLGPGLDAVSGVTTHLNLLLGSPLAAEHELRHFRVGGEGRDEGGLAKTLRLVFSPFLLALTIVRHRVDVVHVNTSLNRAYWRDLTYLFVARAFGARVVYQIHGGRPPTGFARGNRLVQRWLRWTLGKPDVVVVLAEAELATFGAFVPGQHVVVVPNGIDVRAYAALPARAAHEGPLRVAYVGRLAREKGLLELLDALRRVRDRGITMHLTLAGSGPAAAELAGRADELGVGDLVHFAGPVFGEEKLALYAESDLMVLPSWSEGLPYALLEAMAAGVPPVTTAVGAIPDVVVDGTHGHLVPIRDSAALSEALIDLGADRDRLGRMAAACRERVSERYSLDRLSADFAGIYASVTGRVR